MTGISDRGSKRSNEMREARLVAAFLLAPGVLVVWQAVSIGVVLAHMDVNPDGPAAVVFCVLLIVAGFAAPLLGLLGMGLLYVLCLRRKDRLAIGAVMAPILVLGAVCGLLAYATLSIYRIPLFSSALGLLSACGVIVSGLCFYLLGAGTTAARKPTAQDGFISGA
ncbi:MAG: hypothetical protein JW741_12235 [Sedimentisphaerales bacterium]|nr:hypothetical protein [Sedimentisphaerales bacterium]